MANHVRVPAQPVLGLVDGPFPRVIPTLGGEVARHAQVADASQHGLHHSVRGAGSVTGQFYKINLANVAI